MLKTKYILIFFTKICKKNITALQFIGALQFPNNLKKYPTNYLRSFYKKVPKNKTAEENSTVALV